MIFFWLLSDMGVSRTDVLTRLTSALAVASLGEGGLARQHEKQAAHFIMMLPMLHRYSCACVAGKGQLNALSSVSG